MKKILMVCILGLEISSTLMAFEKEPLVSKEQCFSFQKSMIKLITKGEILYQNKDKVNFIDNLKLQQETIRMYNRNSCFLYTKTPEKMKSVGEDTIIHIQKIIDGKVKGGLF